MINVYELKILPPCLIWTFFRTDVHNFLECYTLKILLVTLHKFWGKKNMNKYDYLNLIADDVCTCQQKMKENWIFL